MAEKRNSRNAPPKKSMPWGPMLLSFAVGAFIMFLLHIKDEPATVTKAKLAFLGVESRVQTVTIDNKDTWHRVQIGPVLGRDKADALQKQLKQNSIDSLLMRAKNG